MSSAAPVLAPTVSRFLMARAMFSLCAAASSVPFTKPRVARWIVSRLFLIATPSGPVTLSATFAIDCSSLVADLSAPFSIAVASTFWIDGLSVRAISSATSVLTVREMLLIRSLILLTAMMSSPPLPRFWLRRAISSRSPLAAAFAGSAASLRASSPSVLPVVAKAWAFLSTAATLRETLTAC